MTNVEVISALGSIGEFVGSIGVLATLAYLVAQIRESRKAAESVVVWERAKAMRDMGMIWSTNAQVAELMQEYGQSTEADFNAKFEASPARSFQYLVLNRSTVENMQALYLTAKDDSERLAICARLTDMLERIPGFRWSWRRMNTPGAFNEAFVQENEAALRSFGAGL